MRGSRVLLPMVLAACGGSKSGGGGTTIPPSGGTELTEKDILQRSKPAIVQIESAEGTEVQAGTGFIVDKSGLVATNLHVVSGKAKITVKLHDGETYPVMAVAGIDPGRDLALVRIQPRKPMQSLSLGDSSALAAGDKIVAIGNPLGVFNYTVSNGLVSQIRPVCTAEQVEQHRRGRARIEELIAKSKGDPKNLTAQELEELEGLQCSQELTLLQISAPISQGSSGGPLFNTSGEVVGVTTAIVSAGQNINIAIPANYLKPMVASPLALSMDEFAAKTAERPDTGGPKIVRNVPDHPPTIFDGCKPQQVEQLVKDIWDTIELGAPLYNKGNYEGCFKLYNTLSTTYEKSAPCKGIRSAFGDGLLRVTALDPKDPKNDAEREDAFKKKAWALRDTFDGLLNAAKQYAAAGGSQPKK